MANKIKPLFHIVPLDERDLPGTDDESDEGEPRAPRENVPVRAAVKFDQLGHDVTLRETPKRPPHPKVRFNLPAAAPNASGGRVAKLLDMETPRERKQRLAFKRRVKSMFDKTQKLIEDTAKVRKDAKWFRSHLETAIDVASDPKDWKASTLAKAWAEDQLATDSDSE